MGTIARRWQSPPGTAIPCVLAAGCSRPDIATSMLLDPSTSACIPSIPRSTVRIHVVEDDPTTLHALAMLLEPLEQTILAHDSAESFLAEFAPQVASCLILDLTLPGMGGLELLTHLADRNRMPPTLVLSGSREIEHVVRSMRCGARSYVTKPPAPDQLLAAVGELLDLAPAAREAFVARMDTEQRFHSLTPREREVLRLLLQGQTVKQISCLLAMRNRTAHIHRANILRKFAVETPAQLMQRRASLLPLCGEPASAALRRTGMTPGE